MHSAPVYSAVLKTAGPVVGLHQRSSFRHLFKVDVWFVSGWVCSVVSRCIIVLLPSMDREREKEIYICITVTAFVNIFCFSATVCRCPWLVAEELKVDVLIWISASFFLQHCAMHVVHNQHWLEIFFISSASNSPFNQTSCGETLPSAGWRAPLHIDLG